MNGYYLMFVGYHDGLQQAHSVQRQNNQPPKLSFAYDLCFSLGL
jgi:hypothetical protein